MFKMSFFFFGTPCIFLVACVALYYPVFHCGVGGAVPVHSHPLHRTPAKWHSICPGLGVRNADATR